MSEKTTTPQTLRASAALPASGDYDSSPTKIHLASCTQSVTVECTYTRGGSGGYCALKPELSFDGTTWMRATIGTGVLSSTAPDGTMPLVCLLYSSPVPSSGSALTFAVNFDVQGARYFRCAAAEVGATGTPGTLAMRLVEDAS